jgi:hypothetical protein
MSWFGGVRDLFRSIDGLLQVEQRHAAFIQDLRERIGRLEVREPVLVAAASAAAAQHV